MVRNWLLGLLILVAGAFIWNTSLLYSQNVPLKDPNWFSYKAFHPGPPQNPEVLLNRGLYANGRFSPFHPLGNHRYVSRFEINAQSFEVNAKIRERGYFDLLFNIEGFDANTKDFVQGAKGFSGVRISRHELFPSLYYDSKPSGKFKTTTPLPFPNPETVNVKLTATAHQTLELRINDEKVREWPGSFTPGARVGLFTSLDNLEIENFSIVDSNGQTHGGGFFLTTGWLAFAGINTSCALALALALSFLSSGIFRKKASLIFVRLSAFVFATGLLWFIFDYGYYSKLENYVVEDIQHHTPPAPSQMIEKHRRSLFNHWYELVGGEPATVSNFEKAGVHYHSKSMQQCVGYECRSVKSDFSDLTPPRAKRSERLLVLGGSLLTSCTDFPTTTFLYHLQRKVSPDLLKESLNVSRSQLSITPEIFEKLESLIQTYNPGYFLFTALEIEHELPMVERLAKMLANKNIKFILLVPARNPEFWGLGFRSAGRTIIDDIKLLREELPLDYPRQWRAAWESLRHLARYHRVTMINYNDVLNPLPNTGFVWWDSWHLTEYGMSLFTDAFAKDLTDFMSQDRGREKSP